MRYQLIITFIMFSLFRTVLSGHFDYRNSGAENLALGNSNLASDNNPYAIFYNPAGIKRFNKINLCSTVRNYYGIRGIHQVTAVSTFSLFKERFSIAFEKFGNNLYNENRILIGFAFFLCTNMNLGISISNNSLIISNYGEKSSLSFSFGFLYILNSEISLGVSFSDIYQLNFKDSYHENNSDFAIGFAYIPLKHLTFYTSLSRDIEYDLEYKFGLEQMFENNIVIRIGYEDSLDTISSGLGINMTFFMFNYAFRWHTWLGASHAISLELNI